MKRAMLISAMSLLGLSLSGAFSPDYHEDTYISLPDVSYVKPKYIYSDGLTLKLFAHRTSQGVYLVKTQTHPKEYLPSKIIFCPSPCILTEEKYIRRKVISKSVFSFKKNTLLYHPVFLKQRLHPLKIPP